MGVFDGSSLVHFVQNENAKKGEQHMKINKIKTRTNRFLIKNKTNTYKFDMKNLKIFKGS